MKEQVTEAEKKALDRARDERRDQQPYTSEVDDREVERSSKSGAREGAVEPERK